MAAVLGVVVVVVPWCAYGGAFVTHVVKYVI